MLRILTLPSWNCRLPAGLRESGEDYWNRAELPLSGEWVFIVNFGNNLSLDAPVRSIVVVAIEQLLAVVQELGCERIQSVYQISCGSAELSHAVETNRIESVWAGKLEDESGRVIFSFKTESGEPLFDEGALAGVGRLNRLTKLFEFRVPGTAT